MRFRTVTLFVAVGTAIAFVLSYGVVHTLESDQPVRSLLVSADGRTLAGSLPGCTSGWLETEETDTHVAVWLHTHESIMLFPGSCGMQSFTATLRRPLGNRLLVDGVTRRALAPFNGTGILRPARLPAGFVHRYDTATFPDETTLGGTSGCVQAYSKADEFDETVWITQSPGARWKVPDGAREQPITVRGHAGTAIPGEIEWTERGQLVTVQSRAYAYAVLSTAQLLDIAESLR
jgi:hypothetical protein